MKLCIVLQLSRRVCLRGVGGLGRAQSEGRSVWIFNHYAVGAGVPGGTRHQDLGRELVKGGWSVRVFSAVFGSDDSKDMPTGDQGVSFVRVPTVSPGRTQIQRVLSMLSYMPSAMRMTRGLSSPDVVIGSSVHPFAAWIAWRVARRAGCRFVFEIRDLWPETIIQLGHVSRYHPFVMLLSWIERTLVHNSDRIVSVLPNAYRYLARYRISEDKVVIVPNGVDTTRLQGTGSRLTPSLEILMERLRGTFIAVYAGAHGLANNLEPIIHAASRCATAEGQPIKFLFIGDGPDKARLEAKAQELGLSNVTFVGPLDKRYILPLLTRCNVGLLSWRHVPLYEFGVSPNKLFDYMLAGLPVVMAGDSPGNPIANSGGGIIVPCDDADKVAEAIFSLRNDAGLARDMGLKGKEYVCEKHSSSYLAGLLEKALM